MRQLNWLRLISGLSLALLVIPVFLLLYAGFGPLKDPMGYSYQVFLSVELTLISSAIAAAVSVVLFTPLAYYFARNKNSIGETLSDIPASIPHPIVGVAILVIASPLTPFGKFLISIGINLFDSILGLIIALTIVSAPIYVKSMQPFFQSMNIAHENYALGLGASKFRTFISVVLPNSGRGILSALLISMSRAMSEFGSIAIVAYYVLQQPFYGVNPAPVLIFQYYTYYGLGAAVTASAVMILVSIAMMILLRLVKH
ncbi:MAG TPA: ABC transporter permease [Candidatus Saccharimonadales bacterium]|nr:ABC transporter permease [Candidatus Saccharimonadales bacterium]